MITLKKVVFLLEVVVLVAGNPNWSNLLLKLLRIDRTLFPKKVWYWTRIVVKVEIAVKANIF